MQSSSHPPSTSQQTNTYDVADLGNLPIDDTTSASNPPSVASVLDGRRLEEESQETRVTDKPLETQPGESLATTTSFPKFPPSRQVNWTVDPWWPAKSSNHQHNIWAPPVYNDAIPPISFGKYTPDNNIGGANSFYPKASAFDGNSGFNYPSGFLTPGTNIGIFSPIVYGNDDNNNTVIDQGYLFPSAAPAPASPSPLVYTQQQQLGNPLQGFSILQVAMSPSHSDQLRRILEEGRCVTETMRAVLPSIIELMSDENGHKIFEVLLDRLDRHENFALLYAIVKIMITDTDGFLRAAVVEKGSRSIQKLIRKLKNTGLELHMTQLLSQFALQIMTDRIASHIIRQCFLVLGEGPNKVLYNGVLEYFSILATNPIGCITLNKCIDCITGSQRTQLLSLVISSARQLSYDPSGNFVVQHVIQLSNDVINQYICENLKGQFVQLAQKKGGSHVVEKCLGLCRESSLVIDEIFKNEKTILSLARDQFGNYVVQKALKITYVKDRATFNRVAEVLQPSHSKIVEKVRDHFEKKKVVDVDVLRSSIHDLLIDLRTN